jgi:uncharacterized protein
MQHLSRTASAGERIAVVDVLRAIALLGIIITHCAQGFLAGRPPKPGFMNLSALDGIVLNLGTLLTFGKFFTIFSFLFGLSFALQMRSAAQKGSAFTGRFTWRLVVLALIALVHNLFYAGDILIIYAFLGLLLIPFRAVNTKVLLVVALLLILNIPGLVLGWRGLGAPPLDAGQQQVAAQIQAQGLQEARRQFDIKKSGSPIEIMRVNVTDGMEGKLGFQLRSGRLWITFGLFLLGLCAGRLEIFRDTEAHRALFRRLMWSAGTLAALTTLVAIVRPAGFQAASTIGDLLASLSWSVQQASLSAFYVAVVTLLYWRKPLRGLLPSLAPVGKMGLTVYLAQTVFGVLLFYGFGLGLLGELGVAPAIALGILFFVVQVVLARWWMTHFSMGPVEWRWRSLTYCKLQSNSRAEMKPA